MGGIENRGVYMYVIYIGDFAMKYADISNWVALGYSIGEWIGVDLYLSMITIASRHFLF